MKKMHAWVGITLFLIAATRHADAEELDLPKLTAETIQLPHNKNYDPAQFKANVSRIVSTAAIKISLNDETARKVPQNCLDKLEFSVSRPGAEDERMVYCTTVAGVVTDVPAPSKIWLLKSLERIGKAESVKVETQLLADPDETVRETARRSLAANPSDEAHAELRKAIDAATDPKARASLIEALGFKRDKSDAPIFEKESASADAAVKTAALGALAAQGIRKDSGPQAEAAQLVEMGRGGKSEDIPKLVAGLESSNVKVRQAAVQAVNLNSSTEMTAALIAKLSTVPAETKPALILVLAQRGGKPTQEAFKAELGNPEASIRAAAIQGLGSVGDSSTVAPLMAIALSKQGPEQRAARDSLERLRGAEVDKALIALLADSNPAQKIEAMQRLSGRNSMTAAPPLLNLLADADANVRIEALKALSALGGKDALPPVVTFLVKTGNDGERDQASKTAVAIARRLPDPDTRTEPIVSALPSTEPARIALLGALGQIGGKQALNTVHTFMKDGSEKTEDAAFRALANWPDATPMTELREIARNSKSETQRVLALRGFVRMVNLPSSRSPAETLALFNESMDAVKTNDDKKLFLSGLAEVKDPATLDVCAKFIAEPGVVEEACAAVMKAARNFENSGKLQGHANVLKYVVTNSKNKKLRDEAQALLDKLQKK
jgi:HEAT repeat protein